MSDSAATVDLQSPSGVPVKLTLEPSPALVTAEDWHLESGTPLLSESLKATAYEPDGVPAGETVGITYIGPSPTADLGIRLTVLFPGTIGEEWIHTPPETTGDLPLLVEIWHGTGVLYLHTPVARDLTDTVYTPLHPGDKAVVLPGWAFRLSNTGTTPLVAACFRAAKAPVTTKDLDSLHGLAHYVLADTPGHFDWELNSKYRSVPVPRELKPQVKTELGIRQDEPILTSLAKDNGQFQWLTKPGEATEALNSLYEDEGW